MKYPLGLSTGLHLIALLLAWLVVKNGTTPKGFSGTRYEVFLVEIERGGLSGRAAGGNGSASLGTPLPAASQPQPPSGAPPLEPPAPVPPSVKEPEKPPAHPRTPEPPAPKERGIEKKAKPKSRPLPAQGPDPPSRGKTLSEEPSGIATAHAPRIGEEGEKAGTASQGAADRDDPPRDAGGVESHTVGSPSGPVCIHGPPPLYPRQARQNGWEGTVVVEATVDPAGVVRETRVVVGSGHAVLDQAACAGLKQWRFSEGPSTVRVRIPVSFRLR